MVDKQDIEGLKAEIKEIFTGDPKALQRKYQAEHSEKCKAKMQPIIHLWKVDDKDWLKRRKSDWKILEQGCFKSETKKFRAVLKKYFIQGIKEEYIPGVNQYFITPFSSPEEAKLVFDFISDDRQKETIFKHYIWVAAEDGRCVSWTRKSIMNFIEGVMGRKYQTITIERNRGRTLDISPDAGLWCNQYIWKSIEIMNNNNYEASLDCFDYFLSALSFAKNSKFSSELKVDEFLQLATENIDSNEGFCKEMAVKIHNYRCTILEIWSA